ncbi:MAG TPA: hypothetical protein VFE33_31225 [Thermoanaerobaculia bacterium]|nr:hypothetical protein [Thermoanaerobaculia bacterium]
MKRFVLILAAGALLLAGSSAHPLLSDEGRPFTPASLHAAWKTVEGHYGVLKDDPRGPVFAVSLKDKTGNVLVESVGSDCVVLGGDSSAPGWHTVYPLDRIELQVFK